MRDRLFLHFIVLKWNYTRSPTFYNFQHTFNCFAIILLVFYISNTVFIIFI